MKQLRMYTVIFLVGVAAIFIKASAQEKAKWKGITYEIICDPEVKSDTISKLWCKLAVADLQKYEKVCISYNERTMQFATNEIFKVKSVSYRLEGNFVYFRIDENLSTPFIIIDGIDKAGSKHNFRLKDARGKIMDPSEEKLKWKRDIARVDSMDFVRKFDNVYLGKDGKPRYNSKDGHVYIIEKSGTRLEK